MNQMNRSLLIWTTIVLLVGNLCGCGYRDRVIATNEVSAILKLKLILNRETFAYVQTKKYAPLDQLFSQSDAIPPPSQSGYRFEVRVKEGGKSFEAFATPAEYKKTGRRSFYLDEQGVIHGADKGGGEATPTDPEVK